MPLLPSCDDDKYVSAKILCGRAFQLLCKYYFLKMFVWLRKDSYFCVPLRKRRSGSVLTIPVEICFRLDFTEGEGVKVFRKLFFKKFGDNKKLFTFASRFERR
jgi:hypothetical protein